MPLADGMLGTVRVPVVPSSEALASAISAGSGSLYSVAPRAFIAELDATRADLDKVRKRLLERTHAAESLAHKYSALDSEYGSLRVKIGFIERDYKSGTAAAARELEIADLRRQVSDLSEQLAMRDAEVAALKGRIETLYGTIATLQAQVGASQRCRAMDPLDAALRAARACARALEMALVERIWPGATRGVSAVRRLADISRLFDHFGSDGALREQDFVPRAFRCAPPPMNVLLAGDSRALAPVHARWTAMTEVCPTLTAILEELDELRDDAGCVSDATPVTAQSGVDGIVAALRNCITHTDDRAARAADGICLLRDVLSRTA